MGTGIERATRWADRIVVFVLCASAEYEIWVHRLVDDGWPGPRLALAALAVLCTVPLLWRRRAPLAVLTFVFTAMVVEISVESSSPQPPVQLAIVGLLALYSVAAESDLRRSLAGAAFAAAALLFVDYADPWREPHAEFGGGWLLFGGFWVFGRWTRARWQLTHELGERARLLEREREERARAAVTEERSRIARELHDVVAHSVSVMVIQAQAGLRLLEGEEAPTRQALGSIEDTGRQVLVEMRRVLGVLRRHDAELALSPQPRIGELDALVAQVREAGLPVELHIEGTVAVLPAGVDLSAYRIVQEALTNTLKHAGPASARVLVRYSADELELEIADDGVGVGEGDGSGHGLVGMRERVALYGGVLENGRRRGGGYRVRARLPLEPAGQ
jgi:signal transduction histidine kinase